MTFTEWVSEYATVRGKKIVLNESQKLMLEYFDKHKEALIYKPRGPGLSTMTQESSKIPGVTYEELNKAYNDASMGKEAPEAMIYYGTEEEPRERLDEIASRKTPERPVSETKNPSHGEAVGYSTGTVK
jgi:hypothetical protein